MTFAHSIDEKDYQDHHLFEKLLMDHVGNIIRRGGLSSVQYGSNGMSIYKIEPANRFDDRPEPILDYRGHIHFQGNNVHISKNPLQDLQPADLADPEFHIKLLKFFGVADYEFQIFEDHDVFAGL